jgi:serine/threonine-protein kinase
MKRIVALKVLSKDVARTDTFIQRFQREVETIARLTHPNVVMAFDADEAPSGPFLVMEFVDGRDLASEVSKAGPLSSADAVDCLLQAARGLEYAHAQGIVHRDIKPANLMRDVSGAVKVTDLGLARLNDNSGNSLTQAGGIVGTVDYMPPEQALDSTTIDHRVDVYSLGCTLHFLLTSRPPYEGASFMAVLLKLREAPIPSLLTVRPELPVELDALFQAMLAKKPYDRIGTMTQVAKTLEAVKQSGRLSDVRPAVSTAQAGSDTDLTGATVNYTPNQAVAARTPSIESPAASLVAQPQANPSDAAKLAGRVLVLAETSRTQAGIAKRFLQQLGITAIHTAASGREAIELARRERADVILSSMHLSDMTGLDLAEQLLADPACGKVALVLATSETDTAEAAVHLPKCDRMAIARKPYSLAQIAEVLARTIGG